MDFGHFDLNVRPRRAEIRFVISSIKGDNRRDVINRSGETK